MLNRHLCRERTPEGKVIESVEVSLIPQPMAFAPSAEKALALAQENHRFPHRLCVEEDANELRPFDPAL